MAIDLPPREIIPQIFYSRVADAARIESGQPGGRKGRGGEVVRPEVDVGRGEGAEDGGEELGGAAVEEGGGAVENEGIFVGEAIGEAEVGEGGEKGGCGGVHEG